MLDRGEEGQLGIGGEGGGKGGEDMRGRGVIYFPARYY